MGPWRSPTDASSRWTLDRLCNLKSSDRAAALTLNQPLHNNLLRVQATLQPSITTGDVIDGRYPVDALFGSGGIGAVLSF